MIAFGGRIPVAIHPLFWLFAGFIGWINSGQLFGALIWVAIIFFSVLLHEFGHALTAVFFHQKAQIQLVALGGLTSYEGPKLKFWQQFLIVLNGPLFGFALFLGATFVLHHSETLSPLWHHIFRATQIANLFWTVVNLLPVLPLDGGQLLRILLEAAFGLKGYKASLLIGALLSTLIALGFFWIGQMLAGAFFFLFAFQGFDLWRKSRTSTVEDRNDDVKKLLIEAERALIEHHVEEAERKLEEIREKTKKGLFFLTATELLASVRKEQGNLEEAYQLLASMGTELSLEAKLLLHPLAAEHQNWELVAKLSKECFQASPGQEAALANARAFAHLKQPKWAGGWLHTAWQYGDLNVENLLQEACFQAISQNGAFQAFLRQMR
jgi:stage IV sporulation protein FB